MKKIKFLLFIIIIVFVNSAHSFEPVTIKEHHSPDFPFPKRLIDCIQRSVSLSMQIVNLNEIRNIKGHFSGGEWDKRVDSFNGEKHRILKNLSVFILLWNLNPLLLEIIAGKPDIINEKQYIYYWRGEHDYLIIDFSKKNTLVKWYFAYE